MASPFYLGVKYTVRGLFALFYRFRVIGKENVPKGGGIVAPNHVSHLDPMVIGCSWPEHVHFFARDTLWDKKWLGTLITALQTHPLVRGEADIAAMKKIVSLLKAGEQVVLFPEGTRSPDGQLQEGKSGVAMLAIRANVPILPAYIDGSHAIWDRHRSKPKLIGKMTLIIGKPIYPEEFAHLPKNEAREAMTARTMEVIAELKKGV